jgi:hypothetical protein
MGLFLSDIFLGAIKDSNQMVIDKEDKIIFEVMKDCSGHHSMTKLHNPLMVIDMAPGKD